MLGERESDIYGKTSYSDLCRDLKEHANDCTLNIFQSNHEGEIIDYIQELHRKSIVKGLIINAAGYTHTSIAIRDALSILNIPIIEVHISNIKEREDFRHFSYISDLAKTEIIGKGIKGYFIALDYLKKL